MNQTTNNPETPSGTSLSGLLTALRAAGEVTRLRILVALKKSELTVSELTRVLGQSQPRVSRHLKLLCDAGLLERYQEGAWVFHRISDQDGARAIARGLIAMINPNDPDLERDSQKLGEIRDDKRQLASRYFRQHAREWDSIRSLMVADEDIEQQLIALVKSREINLMLDLGTGTGRILEVLARHVNKGIGYDLSREMLSVARSKLENANVTNCSVRHRDIHNIDQHDGCADLITIHQVLHYLDDPQQIIRESARLLSPGGQLLIVDFLPHDLENLRQEHAHQRLGFSNETITQWCREHGLPRVTLATLETHPDNQSEQHLKVGLWQAQGAQDGAGSGS